MTAGTLDLQAAPLRLYLAYEFLPARQVSEILWSVSNAYDIGLSLFPTYPNSWRRVREDERSWLYQPSLHIYSVATGQSIEWGFGPPGKWLPGFEFSGSQLKVVVPRWSAAAVFAGSVLTAGAAATNQFYELAGNLDEPAASQPVLPPPRHPDDQDLYVMDRVYGEFWRAVETPNISKVRLNGKEFPRDATRVGPRE